MQMTFGQKVQIIKTKVILEINEEEGLNVRCFIQGGGCSGFQWF